MSRKSQTEAEMAARAELIDAMCERISKGETLRAICRDSGMPAWRTVYDWIAGSPDIAARFERAREMGADAIAQECLEIADDATNDWMDRQNKDGSTASTLDTEHIQRSKLRIETRLKLLAKWHPKKYGDKLAIGGADDLPPIKTLTDDALAARIKALQEKIGAG